MDKSELVSVVSAKTGIAKTYASAAVDAVFSTIEEAMISGEEVKISGFGKFETRSRKARTGRVFGKDGSSPYAIPERTAAVFTPYPALKERVSKCGTK